MNRVVWGEWEHREVHGSISASKIAGDCSELDSDEVAETGRMMIQLKQFFCTIGGGERGVNLTNPCKYWYFLISAEEESYSGYLRLAGNCQQKVEASLETWSARLPLDLQTKAVWKEE